MERLYKSLPEEKKDSITAFDYSKYLPAFGKPGEWLPEMEPKVGYSGYHAFSKECAIDWLDYNLFVVEAREDFGDGVDVGITINAYRQIRFLRRVFVWDELIARQFAVRCVKKAWQLLSPEGHIAVNTAERFAVGRAKRKELRVAGTAAQNWRMDRETLLSIGDAVDTARWAAVHTTENCARTSAYRAAESTARALARLSENYSETYEAIRTEQNNILCEMLML